MNKDSENMDGITEALLYPGSYSHDLNHLNTTIPSNITLNDETSYAALYRIEQVVVLSILCVIILVANISVIITIRLSKNRKSRMNFFIIQLAIADIATALFAMLPDILWKVTISWYAGNVGCKMIKSLQTLVLYASTYVLVALTVDRLDAIVRPMSFHSRGMRARVMLIGAWFLAIIPAIPMLILYEEALLEEGPQCYLHFPAQWHWQAYISLHMLFVFILPACIIACCYVVIVATIWSKDSQTIQQPSHIQSQFGHPEYGQSERRKHSTAMGSSSRGLLPKARVKTVKMTFVIVLVFIICWTPWFAFSMLQVYGLVPYEPTLATIMHSLTFLNSLANPIIYCLFSSTLCLDFRDIPRKTWSRIISAWRKMSCIECCVNNCCCCQKKNKMDSSLNQSEYTLVQSRSLLRASQRCAVLTNGIQRSPMPNTKCSVKSARRSIKNRLLITNV